MKEGNQTGIVGRPQNIDERVILATECVSEFKFTIPMVIDGMDGRVNSAYQAAPVRVTVVDIDGNVAFYAGRGPRDFRLPPIESTLKKLIANNGRMPAPPLPAWGQPAEGLRCGLSIGPDDLTVGEHAVIRLIFQNTSDNPMALYFDDADAEEGIVIKNASGQTLKIDTSSNARPRTPRPANNPIRRIRPGQEFAVEIECRIVAASDTEDSLTGRFEAVYHHEVDQEMLADLNPQMKRFAWLGRVNSGSFTFDIAAPEQLGCIDCHGDSDYHHTHEQDCRKCHVGTIGEPDFETKENACSECHPREGKFGRKQILGPGGAFELASRHIPGTIEDKHCLTCHDHSQHRNGAVRLADPDSGGASPWTGTRTAFCLTCHDGDPPPGVVFPEEAKGSGFDKMKFMQSALVDHDQGCSLCHEPHGSQYPSLLKDLHGN